MTASTENNTETKPETKPETNPEKSSEATGVRQRLAGLDALRAWAMLLGVVLHTAISFVPPREDRDFWPVTDPDPRPIYAVLIVWIHLWRMPLFFLVSGLACGMAAARGGMNRLWTGRLKRVGIPLAVGIVVLVPLVLLAGFWAKSVIEGGQPLAMLAEMYRSRPVWTWLDPAHLWFLELILIYVAVAAFGGRVLARVGAAGVLRRAKRRISGWSAAGGWRWVCGLAVASAPLLMLMRSGMAETPRTLLPPPQVLLYYGLFFGAGWAMSSRPGALGEMFGRPRFVVVVAMLLGTVVSLMAATAAARGGGVWTRVALAPASALAAWCVVVGLVQVASRRRGELGVVTRYLADASYWTYLVHLPLVFVMHALAVKAAPMPGLVRLLVVNVAVMAVCLASYEILVRKTWLGRVLNGPSRVAVSPGLVDPAKS